MMTMTMVIVMAMAKRGRNRKFKRKQKKWKNRNKRASTCGIGVASRSVERTVAEVVSVRPSVRSVRVSWRRAWTQLGGVCMHVGPAVAASQPTHRKFARANSAASEGCRIAASRVETRRDEARRGETRRARCAMHLVCTRARTQQANKSRRPIHLAEDNIMYLHVCVLKGDEENADLHRGCMSSARQIHPSSPHQTIRHAARYVSMQRVSTVSTKYVAVLNLGDGCLPVDAPVRPTPRRPGRLGRPPHTHSNDCPPNSIANRTSQVPSAR